MNIPKVVHPPIVPYESQQLTVREEEGRHQCFLVSRGRAAFTYKKKITCAVSACVNIHEDESARTVESS